MITNKYLSKTRQELLKEKQVVQDMLNALPFNNSKELTKYEFRLCFINAALIKKPAPMPTDSAR